MELTALPDALAVFKGPTSKGREEEGEGKGRAREREGECRLEEGREGCFPQLGSLDPPVESVMHQLH